jgi:hypothetical protein
MNLRSKFLLFAAVTTGLLSCKNNDNVFPVKNYDAGFKIINASPNTINYFLNGTRLNNSGGLSPGVATLYIAPGDGRQNFEFKLNGTPEVLFAWPEVMPASIVNYTLYITGTTADKAFRTKEVLNTDSGYVALGFVNASSAAGNLDVTVGDTSRFKATPFKTQEPFTRVADGEREVKIFKAGTTTVLKDTSFTVSQNHIYTIYTYGTPGATGNSQFGVGITQNL